MSELHLAGQVALVTGASSGLGARFAAVLGAAGAAVALAARRTDRLDELAARIQASGGHATAVAMDVTDVAAIRAGVEAAEAALGPISICVNNSGVSVQKRAQDVEEDEYDFVLDTNTKGAFFVAQAVGRSMIRHETRGRIINIASVAGLRTLGGLAVYCLSKAAVVHMTRALAAEWARFGINTNAICPGYIDTEMNHDYWASEGGQRLISLLPRKRVGAPSDLDGLLLLLAGPQGGFINGAIIPADDGHSVI